MDVPSRVSEGVGRAVFAPVVDEGVAAGIRTRTCGRRCGYCGRG